jgi:hypothetical protein
MPLGKKKRRKSNKRKKRKKESKLSKENHPFQFKERK